jgi:2-haloacid dehalogenase
MPAKPPKVIAFDVLGTLFELQPLALRLKSVGLSEHLLPLWYARTLHDGMALDMAGVFKSFQEVATSALEVMIVECGRAAEQAKAEQVVQGFAELRPHPDVAPAFSQLHPQTRIVLLTNGSAENTHHLLDCAGLEKLVERVISIDEVKHWKPRPEVYVHAAKVCGVTPAEMALVAAHAWDTHGAKQVGFATAWVARREALFTPAMGIPSLSGNSLMEVTAALLRRP